MSTTTRMQSAAKALADSLPKDHPAHGDMTPREVVKEFHTHDGWLMTDDFTPEQALTRMAYKTFGEIL